MGHRIEYLGANALPLPCQVCEVHAGASCTEATLTHVSGDTAYVSCPRHGTFMRSERRTSLRIHRTDSVLVVR